jgi:hypothetical protein
MSDFNKNYHKRLAQEYAELDDPIVKGQLQLDAWWERQLERRARARRTEIPECGIYDPMKLFEEEVRDDLVGWGKF